MNKSNDEVRIMCVLYRKKKQCQCENWNFVFDLLVVLNLHWYGKEAGVLQGIRYVTLLKILQ